ncbi:hypothetical protein PR048_007983 [Dryococelus australis]|uniref:Reverse transcriptase/retrotransposon-derived protein RNase H-like domain-containing protein n=1 Tax=Dryococelus australis TaxID=614101 RepID=A0ABQ9HVT3_9NEOP|nr:hypothetical protein PR048_007983 [Dryococelus australis]
MAVFRFAIITKPLTELMSLNESFDEVKHKCQECPALVRHDPMRHLYVQTDASEKGMGVVLFKLVDYGVRQIIDYSSSKFGAIERRYDLNAVHVAGVENQMANHLSRSPGCTIACVEKEWEGIPENTTAMTILPATLLLTSVHNAVITGQRSCPIAT